MSSENKFGMLRKLLRALGLSQQSADDVVNFIVDLLAGERKGGAEEAAPEFPCKDRQARDAFVDEVFNAAVLPLVHIPVRRAYRAEDILTQIAPYLDGSVPVAAAPAEVVTEPSNNPTCPRCGSEMILRTAKKGANAGNQFWGCSNYPTCRTVLSLDEVP